MNSSVGQELDSAHIATVSPEPRVEPSSSEEALLIGRTPSEKAKHKLDCQTACLLVLSVLAVLYTLYAARAVIFPIVLAVVVALPLRAPVEWLTRFRVARFVSAALIMGVVLCVIGLALFWVIDPATQWIRDAPDNLHQVELKLRSLASGTWNDVQEASKEVEKLAEAADEPGTLEVEVKQPSWTSKALNATGDIIIGGTICISLVFLLLAFGDQLVEQIVTLSRPGRDQRNVRRMFSRVELMMSRYLLTYTAINLVLGVVIGAGMWLIGMPNPVLWGLMAAGLNYIPFVGLAVGAGVVTLVGILSFDSIAYAMLAPAIYLSANGLEANILTPALLGRSLQLNVISIFVFIVLWGWLWGIGGALIAVPCLAALKIACDHLDPLEPLGRLLAE